MKYIVKNGFIHVDKWTAAYPVYPFGKHPMIKLMSADAHREGYILADAKAVCDWLNSRPTAEQLTHQGILHALLREQAVPWRVYKLSRPGIPVAEHQLDYNAHDWEVLADLRWRDHTT